MDEFLILCLIRDRKENMEIFKNQLASIGLSLSDLKSYDIVNNFNKNEKEKWIGIAIDKNGISAIQQITQNIIKCNQRTW